jgi:hypothetical protein
MAPLIADPPLPATTLLERVPVERITQRAREARPGRAALAVIGGLLAGSAWMIAKIFTVAWLALAWCGAAVLVGWQEGRGAPPPGPDINQVLAENARLRADLIRLEGRPLGGTTAT